MGGVSGAGRSTVSSSCSTTRSRTRPTTTRRWSLRTSTTSRRTSEDPGCEGEPLFDRPPAIQTFARVGDEREFTVLVARLKSKGSADAQCGDPDPVAGDCDDLRERQARGILDLVEALDADNALLLGDFNSYEEEAPVDVIREGGFASAEERLPVEDRYSYRFDGEFGTVDYAFASPGLAAGISGVDIWHINSAEAPAYDSNSYHQPALYAGDLFASSDHDPAPLGLDLDVASVADAGRAVHGPGREGRRAGRVRIHGRERRRAVLRLGPRR